MTLNRDVIVAVVLLLICGAFMNASFSIREPLFNQMSSALWPRVILTPLAILSFIYLIRSLVSGGDRRVKRGGVNGWIGHYKYPIACFFLFFCFLATLPYLGMLIGGLLYVFIMLTIFGGWGPRQLAMHAAISIVAVGAMWSVFTFGLGVILPPGEILGYL